MDGLGASWIHEGGRIPYDPEYLRGQVNPGECPTACPPPPLKTLSPDVRAIVLYMQELARSMHGPIAHALNQFMCMAPPLYVQQPPHNAPPYRAQNADIFGRTIIVPLGNASALTSANLAAAAESPASSISVVNATTGTTTELAFRVIPNQFRAVYTKLEFRGHDWLASGPMSKVQIQVAGETRFDLQEVPESPKDIFIQAGSDQRVSVMVANQDPASWNEVEVRLSGYMYPVPTKDDSVEGTLMRTSITGPCGENGQL